MGNEQSWVICYATGRPFRVFNSFQNLVSWVDEKEAGYVGSKQGDGSYLFRSSEYADSQDYQAFPVNGPTKD